MSNSKSRRKAPWCSHNDNAAHVWVRNHRRYLMQQWSVTRRAARRSRAKGDVIYAAGLFLQAREYMNMLLRLPPSSSPYYPPE